MTPVVKWAGGKRWLATARPDVLDAFRTAPSVVEPFAGGLALSLAAGVRVGLAVDACDPLVAVYVALRDGTFPAHPPADANAEAYARVRADFNARCARGDHGPATAAAFVYLNRMGFNGLCRFNRAGAFNVPFGKRTRLAWPDRALLDAYRAQLEGWSFVAGDAVSTAYMWPERALVYADPPYDGTFDRYTGAGFSIEDQAALAARLARHPGPVLASNAATFAMLAMYRDAGFDVQTIEAPRRIACNGDRASVREMLASRPAPPRESNPRSAGAGEAAS